MILISQLIHSRIVLPAEKKLLPLQAGDVPDTYVDVAYLVERFHYQSATTVKEGIQRFVAWCRNKFKLN